jgi:hypothetical protein
VVVREDKGALRAVFRGGLLGALLDDVAERHHLRVLFQSLQEACASVGDASAADDADAQFLCHIVPPVYNKFDYSRMVRFSRSD